MALSQSLFSAISGLINHQTRLDNVANNLANVNTVGYKRSVLRFQDILSQTIRGGMAPDGNRGGVNPLQMGLGMQVSTVTQDFAQGGLEATGKQSDLAIEGDGFLKVVAGDVVRYTRDGAFTIGQTGELLTANGFKVHGWNADANNIIDTTRNTEALIIPLGEKRIARETDNVYYTGNLNSSGSVASLNGVLDSFPLAQNAAGLPAVSGTTLANTWYNDGSGWQQLFPGLAVGQTITISAVKGNRTITENIVYAGENLSAFAARIDSVLGLQTIAAGGPVDTGAGASFIVGSATWQVNSNAGTHSEISQLEFTHNNVTTGIFNTTQAADGESAVTSAIVYDSLGNEHLVTLTMSLVSRTTANSTWRWYADAIDDTDLDLAVGNGTVVFDNMGQLMSDSGSQFRIDLNLLGVSTQLVIDPNFEPMTQFANVLGSEFYVRSQDGAPMGVLDSYAIAENGTVSGLFTNGLAEELGKICISRFANNNGLLRDAQNMFSAGVNSGLAQDGEALASGRGAIRAGALEGSNVDLAKEFTELITTQRGFQANARTITTSDEMLVELINLTR